MSDDLTRVLRTLRGQSTSDGAGVRLIRVIGNAELPDLDPFLMLDDFGTDQADDYQAGFPAHPHRGFETVTYLIEGRSRHRDNHGNEGLLVSGSVQWMTAGRGVVHEEMPEQSSGPMRGFQLWVNLPAREKMTAPRYQEFAPDRIPVATPAAGVTIKVIAGQVGEVIGPVRQPATDPVYLDIRLDAGSRWSYVLPEGHNAFAYVFEGEARLGVDATTVAKQTLAVLGGGRQLDVQAAEGARLILVAGRPLREPVARYGPFVMNTREELLQAFDDYEAGRF